MNRVNLYGVLCTEPKFKELKSSKTGKKYLRGSFVLSIDRGYKHNPTDKFNARDLIPVVLWGAAAMYVRRYLHKMDLCWVEGEFRSDRYEDRDGKQRMNFYCAASRIGSGGVRFHLVEKKAQEYYNKQQQEEQERIERDEKKAAKAARQQAKLEDEALNPDWDELDW